MYFFTVSVFLIKILKQTESFISISNLDYILNNGLAADSNLYKQSKTLASGVFLHVLAICIPQQRYYMS